jgi:hypothetical protein
MFNPTILEATPREIKARTAADYLRKPSPQPLL